MSRRFEPSAGTGRRQLVADAAIGMLAFAVSLLPLTAQNAPAWAYVVLAGITLPLVLRRRNPLLANLLILPSAVMFGLGGWPSPMVPIGPLVALHAIAAYGRRVDSYALLALALVAAPGVLFLRPSESEPYEWLDLGLAAIVAWLAGTLTAARRRETRQFEERVAAERALRQAEARHAAAEERNRIARDMHDLLGHSVTVMVVLAEGAAARAEAGHADPDTLDLIAATGRRTMTELRTTLGTLRPAVSREPARPAEPVLPPESPAGSGEMPSPGGAGEGDSTAGGRTREGPEDVADLVETVRRAGTTVEFRSSWREPMSGAAGQAVYRIVQEALTNAMRHAPGTTVTVELTEAGNGRRVRVSNPVVSEAAPSGGHGLRNMRERARGIGAELTCGHDGETWTVSLHVPGAVRQ
ncbi:histidine kinase [Actinoplanes sp. NPDC023801]|uniref:sensor histidine kinase n=1 Tax=Actinoplanes sp. NPDC023801 TaxID=3154595 RepID=UPI0033F67484